MVAIIGLIMFAVSSYLALSKKMHLMVPFVVVPVFAVLYFSVLSETGMFDIMVNRLVSLTKGNIYVVMIVTIIVAFIGHLDGAYNTTYLIAIPALAPLYKKLNIDRRCLVLLVSLAAAPMTAMAWGQPAKMPVYDPNIDPVVMATSLYPVVAIMLGAAIIASLGYGRYYATKNAAEIAALKASFQNDSGSSKVDFSDNPLARPQLFWVNFVLFVVSLLCFMFMTAVPTYAGPVYPHYLRDHHSAAGDLYSLPGVPEHESAAFGNRRWLRIKFLPGADLLKYFLSESMFSAGGGGQPGLRAGRGGYHQAGKIFGDPLYCL